MLDAILRRFVPNHEQTNAPAVRERCGLLSGGVGLALNLLLFAGKLCAGILTGAISVTADAFNNLSDAGSSVIGLVGVKMASKPADQDHPFGHGRIEYIAALIVAFLVMEVGFTFLKDAVGKIRDPEELRFQAVSVVILILSVGVKLWMCFFNRKLGRRIDSKVMLATSADALGDVVTTTATIASVLFFRITGVNIDGIVGLGVSLVVMWAGIGIAKDTLEPLIGEAVEPEEYARIKEFVEGYEGVLGSHDLIVHNYGPGRNMASIHAEVPNDVEIETSHEIIDRIERDAFRMLGVFLVIHMDPVETKDVHVMQVPSQVEQIVKALDPAVSIHDFRMVPGPSHTNLIFDVVIPFGFKMEDEDVTKEIQRRIMHEIGENYFAVIQVDKMYVK